MDVPLAAEFVEGSRLRHLGLGSLGLGLRYVYIYVIFAKLVFIHFLS